MINLISNMEEIRDKIEVKFVTGLFIVGMIINYIISEILYQIS